ncbi:hypothetical protein Aperf_G00000080939 [Anoplocephala perfoliata]
MPFKIPRLEVKFSSQRDLYFTQEASCSSSQVDPLGISYCSQTSRDSALGSAMESSQPEKPDVCFQCPKASELARKTQKFPIKFWNRPVAESASATWKPVNYNRNKPNVRWNARTEWTNSKSTKRETTSVDKNIMQPYAEPPNSQEDIFRDLYEFADEQDDDGFTSASDDCISLSAILDKEE